MSERLGPYVLPTPLGGGATLQTRTAVPADAGPDAPTVRLDALWVGEALTDALRERFLSDAEAAASLDSPGALRIHGHGIDAGFAYVVSRPFEHLTLAEVLREMEDGCLAPELAAALACDVVSALAEAHARWPALVHRGVGPRSILIGADGRARLSGYALVALAQGLARARGGAPGDAAYLSPEIVQDGQVTEATDLFSLGSTLYEALTGRRAFTGPNPLATSINLRMGSYTLLDEVAPDLPADLRDLVRELLYVDSTARPGAGKVREQLAGYARESGELRKQLGPLIQPNPPPPVIPVIKTEPEMNLFAMEVKPPSGGFPAPAAPRRPDPEPPTPDLGASLHPFEDDEPTFMDHWLPPLPVAEDDEPTSREPFTPTMPLDLATMAPADATNPFHGEATRKLSMSAQPVPTPRLPPPSSAASVPPSVRPPSPEPAFPVPVLIAVAVAATGLVGLSAILAAWLAS